MASGNKYKALSTKLYKTLEDLKEIMKAQNNWHGEEINKIVIKNFKKLESDLKLDGEDQKHFKKQDFQRATTFKTGKPEFITSKGKYPSKIMEEEFEVESSEDLLMEESKTNEDKILTELFRANVEYFDFSPVSSIF